VFNYTLDSWSLILDTKQMRCVVTGGAGFIGSHIVDRLIEIGHQVVIVDNMRSGKKENLNPNAKFFQVDVCRREDLESL
jgi:UDP-glucose 4-epimerase